MKITLETQFDVGEGVIADIWYAGRPRGELATITDVYVENECVYYSIEVDYDGIKLHGITAKDLSKLD